MVAPVADVEALYIRGMRGAMRGGLRVCDEKIDNVRAPLVDDRADGSPIDVIEPAADQREAQRRQIDHGRRCIELPVDPRVDRVPVGRQYVGQMPGLQRPQVRRHNFRSDTLLVLTHSTMATIPVAAIAETAEPKAKPASSERRLVPCAIVVMPLRSVGANARVQ